MLKTVVITGGNTGIGLATAHEVAARGARVVLACRNQEKAQSARQQILAAHPGAEVEVMSLDLSSFAHIRRFVSQLRQEHPAVHALINNAGASPMKQQFTEDGFEMQFGANYLGPFLLTHLMLPMLEQAAELSDDARIVHLSSIVHNIGRINPKTFRGRRPYFTLSAYAQSKLGNLMFNYALARRLPDGVRTYAMHPGGVDSDIYRELPGPAHKVLKLGLIPADRAAKLASDLALSDEYRSRSGEYFTAQQPKPVKRGARSTGAQDDLYLRSCELAVVEPLPTRR
jgi:NAD(P)-dependent dehydrogenase (short-subunit alcohol dehydrogenase family)